MGHEIDYIEELSSIRGETVVRYNGNPWKIPCFEISDKERLCKRPLVSVRMSTYKHVDYIRRAIEGVVNQIVDFEFELIVGEDCSQDGTLEICREMQAKHPKVIRVLWADRNVSKLGGNGRRIDIRCRGKYVAYCEGDDYWTDPYKLQKQIDAIRNTGAVMCVADCEWHWPNGKIETSALGGALRCLEHDEICGHYFHTSTYIVSREALMRCVSDVHAGVCFWYDFVLQVCMSGIGRVCYVPNVVSVYNWTGHGAGGAPGDERRAILTVTQHYELMLRGPESCRNFFGRKFIETCLDQVFPIYLGGGSSFRPEQYEKCQLVFWRTARTMLGVRDRIKTMCAFVWLRARMAYASHAYLRRVWRPIKRVVVRGGGRV